MKCLCRQRVVYKDTFFKPSFPLCVLAYTYFSSWGPYYCHWMLGHCNREVLSNNWIWAARTKLSNSQIGNCWERNVSLVIGCYSRGYRNFCNKSADCSHFKVNRLYISCTLSILICLHKFSAHLDYIWSFVLICVGDNYMAMSLRSTLIHICLCGVYTSSGWSFIYPTQCISPSLSKTQKNRLFF